MIESRGGTPLKDGILAIDLLRRPEMDYASIVALLEEQGMVDESVQEQVEIQTKYEGYIQNHYNKLKSETYGK